MKKFICVLLFFTSLTVQAQFIQREDRDKRYLIPQSSDTRTPHQVGLYTHMADVAPHCKVNKATRPVALLSAARDLSDTKYEAVFKYTLKEHIDKNYVMGLTYVRDGKIIDQHYRYERRPSDLFTSFSAGKSIISILIGIALDEGLIKDLNDPVSKYTNRINESSYSKIKIKSLLRMSSGLPFTEPDVGAGANDITDLENSLRYNAQSDVAVTLNNWKRFGLKEGVKFNYASIETAVLAEVLRGATGRSICEYTREKLWEPIGAESDALWETDSKGNELGYVGFNATQADYAKVGVMLANMGEINGKRILSSDYIDQATNVNLQPDGFRFNQADVQVGYGYQFWLRQKTGRYFMIGSYGQYVGIDRDTKSVLVINSADPTRVSKIRGLRTVRLFQSLIDATNPVQ